MTVTRTLVAATCLALVSSPLWARDTQQAAQQPPGLVGQLDQAQTSKGAYQQLFQAQHADEIATLRQQAQPYSAEGFEKIKQQPASLADTDWLEGKGVDFHNKALTQQGIKVLSGFSTLPEKTLTANMATVVAINHDASQPTQQLALQNAFDLPYLHFMADALGPRLGTVFLKAYQDGKLDKAAALIKASELSTGTAKRHFNFTRPFLVKGNKIHQVPDHWIFKDGVPYSASEGSFPSGHTNGGQTDALLLASMLPERFAALVARGDGYGYSRVVLGVHYPLDVMGSRMHAEMVVSHYLNDPAYRKLYDEARQQLRSVLEQGCGESLAACARPGTAQQDPWASAAARSFHTYTMNYGLAPVGSRDRKMDVPKGAEVLLGAALPDLSASQRRQLLARHALRSGDPLDQPGNDWERVDLLAAYDAGKKLQAH